MASGPPLGTSPLVAQILEIMGHKPAIDEERRRKSMQNLVDQLSIAKVVRENAANTPLANAPMATTIGEIANERGISDMSGDVASVAANPQPVPKRQVSVVLPNGKSLPLAPLDYEEEARAKKLKEIGDAREASGEALRVTPEFRDAVDPSIRGLFPEGSLLDKGIAASLINQNDYLLHSAVNPNNGQVEYRIFNRKKGAFVEPEGGAAPTSTGPDYKLSGLDFLNTLPQERQQLVKAIAEGRQKPPTSYGRGAPGVMLMQQVTTYDPKANQQVLNARWQARQDMAKGGQFSAKSIVNSLGQAAKHLKELEQKSANMETEGWATHDSQTVNALGQALWPKGKQAAVSGYKTAADGVETEFIRALSGATPSVEEHRVLQELHDPTLPRANREENIRTMRSMIQARANQQEETFQNIFGHASFEDDMPLFNPNSGWKYDKDTGWQIPGLAETVTPTMATTTTPKAGARPITLDDLLVKYGHKKEGP